MERTDKRLNFTSVRRRRDSGVSLYVNDGSSWSEEIVFREHQTHFGSSVSAGGGFLVAGAPMFSELPGSVFVRRFDVQGWKDDKKISAEQQQRRAHAVERAFGGDDVFPLSDGRKADEDHFELARLTPSMIEESLDLPAQSLELIVDTIGRTKADGERAGFFVHAESVEQAQVKFTAGRVYRMRDDPGVTIMIGMCDADAFSQDDVKASLARTKELLTKLAQANAKANDPSGLTTSVELGGGRKAFVFPVLLIGHGLYTLPTAISASSDNRSLLLLQVFHSMPREHYGADHFTLARLAGAIRSIDREVYGDRDD